MAGFEDLLGSAGFIKQLFVWQVLGQVVSTLMSPAFTVLLQQENAAHPETLLTPDVLANLVVRHLIERGAADEDALKAGLTPERFAQLVEAATVRLAPADLALLELRAQLTPGEVDAQAKPQGYTAEQMRLLAYLAGDALGPEQLAEARRRDFIPLDGKGADSISYEQGIAESRLHNKWGPVLLDLQRQLLSVPDAASAVVRNFGADEAMAAIAEKWGIDAETFRILIHLAADAPGPQQLAEALRRGAIDRDGTGPDSTSFMQGIAEGRLADKWAPVIEALSKVWPTPVDAVDAIVKGQLTLEDGREVYQRLGGDPQFFQWVFDASGDAPSPLELAEMAARGIIKWRGLGPHELTFDQGVAEGRLKDKWTRAIQDYSKYVPPPSEITTFLAHQAITTTRARDLLAEHYMDEDVLAAFINEADLTNLSDYRGLTQSAVVDMYYARLLTRDQALPILEALHVTEKAADLLLSYADLRQVIDSIQRSVQRIAQLYTGRKISTQTATEALHSLHIPNEAVTQILETWQLQALATVKTLSETQIVDAWYYKVLDQAVAIDLLEAIGYSQFDAWVVLSNKAKGPLPNRPAFTAAPSPGPVIPGTT